MNVDTDGSHDAAEAMADQPTARELLPLDVNGEVAVAMAMMSLRSVEATAMLTGQDWPTAVARWPQNPDARS